jgi:cell division protein FtsB
MRLTTFAIAALLTCAAGSASAQVGDNKPAAGPPHTSEAASATAEKPAPLPPPRYTFNRVDGSLLRLDTQTGQVAYCSQHTVGWVCEAVPEDRAALEKEIARLQGEVASLKREIAALREPPPPRPPAELTPPSSNQDADAARLREDLTRFRVAFEKAWRRLVDMIVNFQKDIMRKG